MKAKKILTMICGCVAAMCFTSCLKSSDDSEDTGLTKAEIAQCLSVVKGNYDGDLMYPRYRYTEETGIADTLEISWSITNDTTATIYNFPAKALAEHVDNNQLKSALESAPDKNIKCYIGFISTSPVTFLINPIMLEYELQYGNGMHKVQVAFYMNTNSSFGYFSPTDQKLYMQILEGAVYVDGMQYSVFSSPIPFVFTSSSKY